MAVDLSGHRLQGGKYEIQGTIAQGGMATVYAARARDLDATVAVKVMSSRLAADPSFKQRFREEAISIANLHHPNIIEVYDCAEEDDLTYIAMRHVAAGTLKNRLEEIGGLMDLRAAAKLIAQVAGALQHAHDQGLVHLDVKPANILMGNASWPLLTDFGIIRIAGDARDEGRRIAGTPAYMSPEQWLGQDLDGRSDQYSLALTFYELVTGRRPFSGVTSAELKAQHIGEEPPRPRQLNPGIPGPVEEVMLRAMAKRPEDRYPTIDEFGLALLEAVDLSRGMQLETKQIIATAAPSLVALIVLSVFAPLLASLADPSLPIYRSLSMEWPIRLAVAILQVALLLGIRWHLIGLFTRMLGSVVDALDRFTRSYIRVGTDAQGPLRVKSWRNAAVGSAEGIVNIAYLFIIYQLVGVPIAKSVELIFWSGEAALIITGLTALVLVFAAGIIFRIRLTSGPIIAVFALAICWGLISALPVLDMQLSGGISLQWVAKLVVGLAVLAAFLSVRGSVQAHARDFVVPALHRQMAGLQKVRDEQSETKRLRGLQVASDGIVNVVFLVLGYPIIAAPTRGVLEDLMSRSVAAILITLAIAIIGGLLVYRLQIIGGVLPATFGLLLLVPTLLNLPLFEDYLLGSTSLQWVARLAIGLGVLALFLGVRRRLQAVAQAFIVPAIDRQLSSLVATDTEEREAARLQVLAKTSDSLVNVAYLVAGYFTVVLPVTAAVTGYSNLNWVSPVTYAVFLLAVAVTVISSIRRIVPALHPSVATA